MMEMRSTFGCNGFRKLCLSLPGSPWRFTIPGKSCDSYMFVAHSQNLTRRILFIARHGIPFRPAQCPGRKQANQGVRSEPSRPVGSQTTQTTVMRCLRLILRRKKAAWVVCHYVNARPGSGTDPAVRQRPLPPLGGRRDRHGTGSPPCGTPGAVCAAGEARAPRLRPARRGPVRSPR